MRPTFELVLILRESLKRMEETSDPHDPAFLKLKSSMLQAIADLESSKEEKQQRASAASSESSAA
jgi:hypothetical protein